MTKQFLYIVDPLPSLNVRSDTTLTLMEEASARGIKTFACEIKDIFLKDGQVHFMAAPVELKRGYSNPPTYLENLKPHAAHEFAAIFMRKDPPIDEAFLASLLMLRSVDKTKTVMVNDADGMLLANEKLFGQHVVPGFFPPTLVSNNPEVIDGFSASFERVVIKPLFKSGGAGVLVFDRGDKNWRSALELLSDSYSRPIMVQAYIKEARAGDKRILLLGGEPLGAVLRVPHDGDHRANFHAGGKGLAYELTKRDCEIVSALKPHLLALGLHFVGIDVIGDYLTEINVTSPTCLIEIEQLSKKTEKKPIRAQVIDYVEKLLA